jgi:hypothetical protein
VNGLVQNEKTNVQLNDVFFSDSEDDRVIDLVERELQLKRANSFEVFESSSEISIEEDVLSR